MKDQIIKKQEELIEAYKRFVSCKSSPETRRDYAGNFNKIDKLESELTASRARSRKHP